MYLIDTNILLEILLSQEHAEEAKQFLAIRRQRTCISPIFRCTR